MFFDSKRLGVTVPARRVNPCQLSIGHINAPERQKLADELSAEIGRKKDQLRLTQLLLKSEKPFSNLAEKLRAREAELDAEIRELDRMLCQLGGHPRFRTPVVEGCGLADALRTEREKEERRQQR
ncbi:MAG: hypothetical protein WD889_00220 [Candidatus Colwellbacteria bacterium]